MKLKKYSCLVYKIKFIIILLSAFHDNCRVQSNLYIGRGIRLHLISNFVTIKCNISREKLFIILPENYIPNSQNLTNNTFEPYA